MSAATADLGATVTALAPFIPCDDFDLCRRFYAEIGFTEAHADAGLAIFACGGFRFILQNDRWPDAGQHYMVQLGVTGVDAWWRRLESLDLPSRFGARLRAPEDQPWGARVLFLHDPTGVLWHISQRL